MRQLKRPFGALYASGLLLVNMFLSNFGVFDFSAFRVQFVITGILFIVYLVLPVLPIVALRR
jgi:hypothetical protein